jgi:hypothetical protein
VLLPDLVTLRLQPQIYQSGYIFTAVAAVARAKLLDLENKSVRYPLQRLAEVKLNLSEPEANPEFDYRAFLLLPSIRHVEGILDAPQLFEEYGNPKERKADWDSETSMEMISDEFEAMKITDH